MSKPEWNEDTPEWANWLGQDSDGTWVFYEETPVIVSEDGGGYWSTHRLWMIDSVGSSRDAEDWQNTLEPRP